MWRPLPDAAESWPPDAVPDLIADVSTRLADYVADDGVLFPICAYVITATVPR